MPTHAERRLLPYTPAQMYALVADIEKYPSFLPWCLEVRRLRQKGDRVDARMSIGFKALRESFDCTVTLTPCERVEVEYLNGPFKYLNNHWVFEAHPQGCAIDFYIDFEFKSKMLQLVIGTLFNEAVRIMVRAFETRARQIYGTSTKSGMEQASL